MEEVQKKKKKRKLGEEDIKQILEAKELTKEEISELVTKKWNQKPF